MDSNIEYKGIDEKTSLRKLKNKENERLSMFKRRVRIAKKQKVFQRPYLRNVTKKLVIMGLIPDRIWRHEDLGICPSQRRRGRRQVTEMSGKEKRVSLDTFVEAENMEIEHGARLLVVSMTEGLQFFDTKSLAKRATFSGQEQDCVRWCLVQSFTNLLSRNLQAPPEQAANMETHPSRVGTYNAETADLARKLVATLVALCNQGRAVNILLNVEMRNGIAVWWRLKREYVSRAGC